MYGLGLRLILIRQTIGMRHPSTALDIEPFPSDTCMHWHMPCTGKKYIQILCVRPYVGICGHGGVPACMPVAHLDEVRFKP